MIKYRHEFGEKIMKFTIKHKETKIKFGEKKYPPKIKFGEKRTAITINGLKKIKDIPAFHQGTHIPINSRALPPNPNRRATTTTRAARPRLPAENSNHKPPRR